MLPIFLAMKNMTPIKLLFLKCLSGYKCLLVSFAHLGLDRYILYVYFKINDRYNR